MIVGTAGHIDHGKTSLVRALTGVDTDRLKEEKARGITIELGFAYLPRPTGTTIGFIDVPGHERLVHTMLAGATGIDLALLVIACDDDVMPQTREHLAIIELLGIARGIVALTKRDTVTPARLAEVAADVSTLLAPTRLAGIEIVPASSVTGEGVAALLASLDAAASATLSRTLSGRFRLAVDRVFSLAGAGTVVTGTALSGMVRVGDAVVVSPAGIEARVRSIHAQNCASETGSPGQRCALALVGPRVSVDSVQRGDVVVVPSLHAPVKRFDARVTLLSGEKKRIESWIPVKLHHGSTEFDARVLALSDKGIGPGESGYVQFALDRHAALAAGDRIVLRDTSATRTIGGGLILDLHPPERQRRSQARFAELDVLADAERSDPLPRVLAMDKAFVDLDQWFRDRAETETAATDAVAWFGLVVLERQGLRVAMLPATWEHYATDAASVLGAFHAERPDLPGMGQERLRYALVPRLPAPAFAEALARLVRDGIVAIDRSWVRLPGHEVRPSDDEERLWLRIEPLLGGAEHFRPPRVRDVAKLQKIDEAFLRRLFKLAARRGDADEIAQDHFFLAGTGGAGHGRPGHARIRCLVW